MSKEVDKIYPSFNLGARKGRTRNVRGVGIDWRGWGGRSGRGGGRLYSSGQWGGLGTHKTDIYNYVDGTETYFPQEVWRQLGSTSKGKMIDYEQLQASVNKNNEDNRETISVDPGITMRTPRLYIL